MAYAPLARRVAELVAVCAEGTATPRDRLALSRLLGEAGLFEEASAAAGVAADRFERDGDGAAAADASLTMAEHLAHLGFRDLAQGRLERAIDAVDGVPAGSALHRQVQQVLRCLAAGVTGGACRYRPPTP